MFLYEKESNTDIGIDTPLVSGSMEDSPLISKLLAVDEYAVKDNTKL